MQSPQDRFSFLSMNEEHFKRLVAVSIALISVLIAVLTNLQSDAAARDDQANRDSKRYSVEAFGRQVSGNARVNFDDNSAYQILYEAGILANGAAARQDNNAALRYRTLAEESRQLSPLLRLPYYQPPEVPRPDVLRYEADSYLVEMTTLQEKYSGAWAVKLAWDYKANTYIFYLTLLALALFFFGLSVTISGTATRWIFVTAGTLLSTGVVIASILLWSKPVFDLRQQGRAIDEYARGVGLAYQNKHTEAVAAFDQALQAYPAYANALVGRADSYLSLNQYERAAADYAAAIKAGDSRTFVAGNLAWVQYLSGDFKQSAQMNRQALRTTPDELWIQFDLGLALLADGQIETARSEYERGMQSAMAWVARTSAAGEEPPASLWWSLQDAADGLDDLLDVLEEGRGNPPPASVTSPDQVRGVAQELVYQLKSLAIAMEYTNRPPGARTDAKTGPLHFAEALAGQEGYAEPGDEFKQGVKKLSITFDYAGMQNGQNYLIRLYLDGIEDPSWRMQSTWDAGPSGSMQIPLSYEYSDAFEFPAGEYMIEFYVDYNLVQRGWFVVTE